MIIFAVLSVALFWVTFATTKERVVPQVTKSNVRLDIKTLLSNGPWAVLFASAIVTLMNIAVRNGSLLYYFKYYVGDDGVPLFLIFDKTAVFLSLGLLSMIGGILLTRYLAVHFEKRALMIALTLLNAVTMAAFFYIPPEQYWLMVLVNCIGSFLIGPTPALVWSMYADCADYGEWKSGRRITALVFSTVQFAQKMGLAVGAGLLGIVLGAFGFVANEAQSETSMMGIRLMFSILPAALAVLGAMFIFFYRIDHETIVEMEEALALRHAKTAEG
jgi:GPH family glycoside/pentoside/hexuronide:cation symporter